MTEAEKERAAIVEWMRENGNALMKGCTESLKFHNYENAANSEKLARRDFANADAIELGAHLK